ncbi:succinylglutamate desuccinylase [Mesorhizobium loti]|nr:succinylglutamate desuccinylase/aspartoacylase family protein [Mesorhizobium loti]PLP60780.1 succinylglutamate desuccinylase [Mesorhizobium loti]
MSRQVENISLLASHVGNSRTLKLYRYGQPGARPKAYVQASLHADEIPPMLVQHHLLRLLDKAEREGAIRGEIVVVPVANPVGVAQVMHGVLLGRFDFPSGANANRNWPDLSIGLLERVRPLLTDDASVNVSTVRAAMAEILASAQAVNEMASLRLALANLAYDADIVLDLHCDMEALPHLFMHAAHWPAGADLAAEVGSQATMLTDIAGNGTFEHAFAAPWIKLVAALEGSHPLPLGCFAATMEYRGSADVDDSFAVPDAQALFRFLQRRGLIGGSPDALSELAAPARLAACCDTLRAPVAGIIAYRKALGSTVKRGEVIAELVDPLADDPEQARQPIVTETDGIVLSRRLDRLVQPGRIVARVFGEHPLPYRKGLLLDD